MPHHSSNMPSLELGSTLGNFRLLSQLGEGGMGIVFLAEDLKLGRRVALKVMQPRVGSQQQVRARFLREARVASLVEHERIVRVYQVDEDRGVPFIAMELLRGESLDRYLEKNPIPSLKNTFKISLHVAQGLSVAHRKGLIHRDIKPSNVWMEAVETKTGFRCKILDFGLAREVQGDSVSTHSGKLMGTPAYMSPEQWRGKDLDHRADLFSLGAMMYQMMTGELPFGSGPTIEIARAIAVEDPIPPVEVNNHIPPILSDLVMQLLEKAKERRPTNAEEIIARLEAFAEHREPDASKWSGIEFGMASEFPMDTNPPHTSALPTPRSGPIRRTDIPIEDTEPIVEPRGAGLKYALVGALLTVLIAGMAILGFLILNHKKNGDDKGEQAKLVEKNEGGTAVEKERRLKEEAAKREELQKLIDQQKLDTEESRKKAAELQKQLVQHKAEVEERRLKEEAARQQLLKEKLEQEARDAKEKTANDQILKRAKKALDGHDYEMVIRLTTDLIVADPESSLAFSYRAMAREATGDNESSVKDAERAVELAPNSAHALAVRGYVVVWDRHAEVALEDCNRAIKLDPKLGFAYSTRGAILSYLYPDRDLQAREDCDRGIDLEPTGFAYCCRGDLHHRNNDLDNALADYTYAIRIDPNNPLAYQRRGGLFRDQNNRNKALADFNRAVELGPKLPATYASRSGYYSFVGEFDKALADADKALALNRRYLEGYSCRAEANRGLKRIDLARADCQNGLAIDPKSPDLYRWLGTLAFGEGHYETALEEYSRAIEHASRPAYLHVDRAETYRMMGKFDDALDECRKASALDGRRLDVYFTRAAIYEDQKQTDSAIKEYTRIIDLDPKNSTAYCNRAQVHYENKDYDDALDDADKAIENNPKNASAYNVRGNVHYSLNDYDKSIDNYSKAIELSPEDPVLFRNRAGVYTARAGLGDADRAKDDNDAAEKLESKRNTKNAFGK